MTASLEEDRKQRAGPAGAFVADAALNQGRRREGGKVIRHWLMEAADRPLTSLHLEKTLGRLPLIVSHSIRSSLPPDRIPIRVAPFDIEDAVLEPDNITQVVRGLKNGKSPGPSKVRAEHLKEWMEEV